MVFDKLRSRIIGRNENTAPSEDAIRAHVLGEIHPPSSPPFPAPAQFRAEPRGRYSSDFEGTRRTSSPEELAPPELESFPQAPREMQVGQPPREFERRLEERGLYEIMDRLSVIETQLATIRAQNETLNERMKTFEMYLRSRMPKPAF